MSNRQWGNYSAAYSWQLIWANIEARITITIASLLQWDINGCKRILIPSLIASWMETYGSLGYALFTLDKSHMTTDRILFRWFLKPIALWGWNFRSPTILSIYPHYSFPISGQSHITVYFWLRTPLYLHDIPIMDHYRWLIPLQNCLLVQNLTPIANRSNSC